METKTPNIEERPSHTPDGQPIIYFTFDDGPAADTPDVLAALADNNARATFFVLGGQVKAYPDLLRAEVEAGHYVANHTFNHPSLRDIPHDVFVTEMNDTFEIVQSTVGDMFKLDGRMYLMRPPYGHTDDNTAGWARELGYDMVLWTIDPWDWNTPGTEAIVTQVLAEAQPGAIVLLHDGGGDRSQTAAALRQILPALAEKGYVFHNLYLGW